jgi:hypothetical protein
LLPGSNLFEKITLILLNLKLIFFYYYATLYILQCVVDFRRKIYLQECMKRMIYKNKTTTKKYVPNINVLDLTSALTWYKMRRIVRYYGNNMSVRHEILIPAIFLYMVFIYMFNWFKNLDIIDDKNSPFIQKITPILYVDYVLFTAVILTLFLTIAWLNYYVTWHCIAIQRVKIFVNDLRYCAEHFGRAINPKWSMAGVGRDVMYDSVIDHPMYKIYSERLRQMVPQDKQHPFMTDVFELWNFITNYVNEERTFNLICILRIPIEMSLVVNTAIGMAFSGLGMLKVILDTHAKKIGK